MNELKPKIHDETSSLDYVLVGDYYIPAIELSENDDRPIGKWGRMHRAYLEETNPLLLNHLITLHLPCQLERAGSESLSPPRPPDGGE